MNATTRTAGRRQFLSIAAFGIAGVIAGSDAPANAQTQVQAPPDAPQWIAPDPENIENELSSDVEVSEPQSDLIAFLQTGELVRIPYDDRDYLADTLHSDMMCGVPLAETIADIEHSRTQYLAARRQMCRNLTAFCGAVEAQERTGSPTERAARIEAQAVAVRRTIAEYPRPVCVNWGGYVALVAPSLGAMHQGLRAMRDGEPFPTGDAPVRDEILGAGSLDDPAVALRVGKDYERHGSLAPVYYATPDKEECFEILHVCVKALPVDRTGRLQACAMISQAEYQRRAELQATARQGAERKEERESEEFGKNTAANFRQLPQAPGLPADEAEATALLASLFGAEAVAASPEAARNALRGAFACLRCHKDELALAVIHAMIVRADRDASG